MIASVFRHLLAAVFMAAALPVAAQNFDGGAQLPGSGDGRERVVKDPRSRAKIHTELGALYFQEGNIPVAMEELTVAIYIDKTYAPAYSMRALVHHHLREPNHAEDNFREALRYGPDDPEIANNYGWFLCRILKERCATASTRRRNAPI
jgi:type IV pilus assembly protein PilF